MRDPKRIDRITKLINKAWHLVPDFRFWQFLTYAMEYLPDKYQGGDLFFAEDDVWKKTFEGLIEAQKNDYEEDDMK